MLGEVYYFINLIVDNAFIIEHPIGEITDIIIIFMGLSKILKHSYYIYDDIK